MQNKILKIFFFLGFCEASSLASDQAVARVLDLTRAVYKELSDTSSVVYNVPMNSVTSTAVGTPSPLLVGKNQVGKNQVFNPLSKELTAPLTLSYSMEPKNNTWLKCVVNSLDTPIIFALSSSSFFSQGNYSNVILIDPSTLNPSLVTPSSSLSYNQSTASPINGFVMYDKNSSSQGYIWDGLSEYLNPTLNGLTGDEHVVLQYQYVNNVSSLTVAKVTTPLVALPDLQYSNYLPIQFGLCIISAGQVPTQMSSSTQLAAPYTLSYILATNSNSWSKAHVTQPGDSVIFTLNTSTVAQQKSLTNLVALDPNSLNPGYDINQYPLSGFTFKGAASHAYDWYGLKDLNNILQNLTGNEIVALNYDQMQNIYIYMSPTLANTIANQSKPYSVSTTNLKTVMTPSGLTSSGNYVTTSLIAPLTFGYTMGNSKTPWLYRVMDNLTTPIVFALNSSPFAQTPYSNVILLDPSQLKSSNSASNPLSNFVINDANSTAANPEDYDWAGMSQGLNQALNALTPNSYIVLSYVYDTTNNQSSMQVFSGSY